MPLGLMPGMRYEEQAVTLAADDSVLLYSDGLVEAHDANRAMFGGERLATLIAHPVADQALIDHTLAGLGAFVGPDWEQEDDVTLVTLRALKTPAETPEINTMRQRARSEDASVAGADDARMGAEATKGGETMNGDTTDGQTVNGDATTNDLTSDSPDDDATGDDATRGDATRWRTLGEWALPSREGDERLAMAWVARAFAPLALPTATLERLKTAVAEATMNAMEHGNQHDPTRYVYLEALASPTAVAVRVGDDGAGMDDHTPTPPNLAAKLAGAESPRGWGLFLIRQLVDEARVEIAHGRHTVRLVIAREAPTINASRQPDAAPDALSVTKEVDA
jgi:anti-sigma regulatory factor (Ser/Thr protein kinase)